MALIKSHSKYVVKGRHQKLADGGVVYERDMSTVGALSEFPNGQTPIYRNGNFIISVNKDLSLGKEYGQSEWATPFNGEDGNKVWTLDNMSDMLSSTVDSMEIELKQDCYNLKDFAYYGSCSELIRSSLVDIVNRFPGELYAPKVNGEGIKVFTKKNEEWVRLGGNNLYLLDNPFNIDIHTEFITEEITSQNPLHYFANEGKTHYEVFMGDDGTALEVTWNVRNITDSCDGHIATITLNNYTIEAYLDHLGQCYYLVDVETLGLHIRPKTAEKESFFQSLDMFQKTLLNKDSNPLYSALFEVVEEEDYSYSTKLQRFTFPLTYGGYNLGVNTQAYTNYVGSLSRIAEIYDEMYSDNLYRTMTHESIKNFDWTQASEEHDEYEIGGAKIQNSLRLLGRVFDEVKLYADSIGHVNQITYNGGNNLPDYFLTDTLDLDGWDIVNIYPFKDNLSEDVDATCTPYASKQAPYFMTSAGTASTNSHKYSSYTYNDTVTTKKAVHPRIKQYVSDKAYTMNEVNNHFMRMLKLNSKHLLRNKGTKNGVEMLLSLFGLKSATFVEKVNNSRFWKAVGHGNDYADFDIKEYVTRCSALTDTNNEILKFNKKKLIPYKTTNENTDYQGLPVRIFGQTEDENKFNILVPYFSKNREIDGNPYYQSNGGWLHKQYQMNNEGSNVVTNTITTTLRNVTSVSSIRDLFEIPYNKLHNNHIVEVRDRTSNCAIIDGVVYDIKSDTNGEYIDVIVNNSSVRVGQKVFIDNIIVSTIQKVLNDDKTVSTIQGERSYNLKEFRNMSSLRIYIHQKDGERKIVVKGDGLSINNIRFYNNGYLNGCEEGYSKYFMLYDRKRKNSISGTGWRQLSENSDEYKSLNVIKNYYKGNNPHNNNFNTDLGCKYFASFTNLFKYSIDNNLIDKRCFKDDEEYMRDIDTMSIKGFSGIFEEGDGNCDAIILIPSPKVHYFGNKIDKDNNELRFIESQSGSYINDEMGLESSNTCDIIDSIINTKRILIQFKNLIYNKEIKRVKYTDKVLFHYLEQVLPSNAITVLSNGLEVTSQTQHYNFDVEPRRVSASGGQVDLDALYHQMTSTTVNGITTTDKDTSNISQSVTWYVDGQPITPTRTRSASSKKYTLPQNPNKDGSEVQYVFSTSYNEDVELKQSNTAITVTQGGLIETTKTYYTYSASPDTLPSGGGVVNLSAILYKVTITNGVSGDTSQQNITENVIWKYNGKEIGQGITSYKIGPITTSDGSKAEYVFSAEYDAPTQSKPITVIQDGYQKPKDEEYFEYSVTPLELPWSGGDIKLSAILYTKTTNNVNGQITSTTTSSSITDKVTWEVNGNKIRNGATSYHINENKTTSITEYTFSATYNEVMCETEPIAVKQLGQTSSSTTTDYYTFDVTPKNLPYNDKEVTVTATKYTITTITNNGEITTSQTSSDVTSEVSWKCNGKSFTPSNDKHIIGENESQSEREFEFTTTYGDIICETQQPIIVTQEGKVEKYGSPYITLINNTQQQNDDGTYDIVCGAYQSITLRVQQKSNFENIKTWSDEEILANGARLIWGAEHPLLVNSSNSVTNEVDVTVSLDRSAFNESPRTEYRVLTCQYYDSDGRGYGDRVDFTCYLDDLCRQ